MKKSIFVSLVLFLALLFPQSSTAAIPSGVVTISNATAQSLAISNPLVRIVSVSNSGEEANLDTRSPAISADGRYVVFLSQASNLVPGDTNKFWDIFLHDRETNQIERISKNNWDANPEGNYSCLHVSPDGRYIVFCSTINNIVPGDTNGAIDIFLIDRVQNTIELISTSITHGPANGSSWEGQITPDGRFVVFTSSANNLVNDDTNNKMDVFVRDRVRQTNGRVSLGPWYEELNGNSVRGSISDDGKKIAFQTEATNASYLDTDTLYDIYVRDRDSVQTTFVSVPIGKKITYLSSHNPMISGNGRFVVFESYASNLVSDDSNQRNDVFTHDLQTHQTERDSVTSSGKEVLMATHFSATPSITPDGRYVTFIANSDLVENAFEGYVEAFVRDRQTGRTQIVSVSNHWRYAMGNMNATAISADGRYVAYSSSAGNLVDGFGKTGTYQIYVEDRSLLQADKIFNAKDTYFFANQYTLWGTYPETDKDFLKEDLRHMFGDPAVCWMVGSTCNVRPQAEVWRNYANLFLNNGHADGFAATSLRFFTGLDQLQAYKAGVTVANTLAFESVRRHIAYYNVLQLAEPLRGYKENARQIKPSEILQQVQDNLSGLNPGYAILSIHAPQEPGDSFIPYAVEDHGGGQFVIQVQRPSVSQLGKLNIDTIAETWDYQYYSDHLSGNASSHNLGVIPLAMYAEQPVCPWCPAASQTLAAAGKTEIWLAGAGHLLINDSNGNKIGFTGAQFTNQMTGAYASAMDGGNPGAKPEPIYVLPTGESYTILLDGQTLSSTGGTSLAQFGPGFVAEISHLSIGSASQEQIGLSPDGRKLSIKANDTQLANLRLAWENVDHSNMVQIEKLGLSAGSDVTLSVQAAEGIVIVDGKNVSASSYNFHFTYSGSTGEKLFASLSIPLAAGATHRFYFGEWAGNGPIRLEIDQNSDGEGDQTLYLRNQAFQLFVPQIAGIH